MAALPSSAPAPAALREAAPGLRRSAWLALVLLVLSVVLLLVGASVGSTGWESVLRMRDDPTSWQIVVDIRLPRSLGAWLAGGLLGLAGAVAQGLFRNPLADPYLLGSASGASLGSALGLVLLGSSVTSLNLLYRLGMTGMAFVGAACAVALTVVLARNVQNTLRLLLAGVIVGVVLGAMRDLLELRHPDILQAMQAFTLGTSAFVGWEGCALMAAVLLVCVLATWCCARVLDGLTLGEATAASLGLPLAPLRYGLVAVLALATGTSVAQTGLIAFVGLAAPHLVRSLVQVGHGRSTVLAAAMGGVLLLAADILARWLVAPQELPVGVLTAALGGTYLLWRMHRSTRSAGGL
ncbi:iron complex transport system permease protein [Comamonas sp. JUb58]|nr:iron ABC transporter permease [Comamonas sp. JUb58]TDS85070.1 iron complex transport system permease protein [Comamonas sp. JUb58]